MPKLKQLTKEEIRSDVASDIMIGNIQSYLDQTDRDNLNEIRQRVCLYLYSNYGLATVIEENSELLSDLISDDLIEVEGSES